MKRNIKILKFTIYLFILILCSCNKNKLPPVARFSFSPEKGNLETQFIFDASKSSDDVEIRWDFEGDGNWDTNYSSELIQQHTYDEPDTYNVKLQVKDNSGLKSVFSRALEVVDHGPLFRPEIIAPMDSSTNYGINNVLSWTCFHAENKSITYDVYFGKGQYPPLFKKNYISTIINTGLLESGTTYSWKIVARDESMDSTSTRVLTFSTHLFDKRDGNSYDVINIGSQWWMAENININIENGSWCFNDDPKKCEKFGSLYNWGSALVSCPLGWHLPTDDEWKLLEIYLLMTDIHNWGPRGDTQGDMIKVGGSSGFNALMAGTRNEEGNYSIAGIDTGFWTSSGQGDIISYRWVFYDQPYIYRYTTNAKRGFSVRCLKD